MLKKKYGMTEQCYEEMLESQGGGCAICGAKKNNNPRMKYLCIDHSHKTGKVRGILCQDCNFFLGHLEKQLSRLDLFTDFILKHDS